jgi:choice-of-anchor B domain-containing protein
VRATTAFIVLVIFLNSPPTQSQTQPFILDSLAAFQFGNEHGSDCWGWAAPNGDPYAIMGIDVGIVFVNAATLEVADTVTGSGCLWQDMATWGHYCYAVSECGTGLRVIDLQYLPDSAHLVGVFPVSSEGLMSSHNLSIDSIQGFIYLEGEASAGRAIFVQDLVNPAAPVYESRFGNATGIHDLYAYNDTVYVAEGYNPYFSIWDLSTKFLPQRLLYIAIPDAGYVHNIWPTADRRYVVTTEETAFKTVKIWNIENPSDVQLVGEYLAPNGLAHNAHVEGDYIYLSHYESGAVVLNMQAPECVTEVAHFDTYPQSEDPSYNGAWGIFPHTYDDSLVYASNVDGRLFIFRLRANPDYVGSELDGDGDMIVDGCDNCLSLANTDQLDSDDDGIGDACDNCPETAGQSQTDSDGDGLGNLCDLCPMDPQNDADSDAVCGNIDNCPTTPNPDQVDNTSDGVGDACCCLGLAGNVDADVSDIVDIGDLTRLIDFLYLSRSPVTCPDEANVDADPERTIDIGDLTSLIGFLYVSGSSLPSCP